MKLAAKIFTIIGMIVGLPTIVAPIVGFLALKKMNEATQKSDLTVMAILNLIFCNIIGGILMLVMSDADLQK